VWIGKVRRCISNADRFGLRDAMAWHYKSYEREQSAADRQLCAEAEIRAAAAKQGLWVDRNPVATWD
jgi:endonuclease YncB( thermonuclease family)